MAAAACVCFRLCNPSKHVRQICVAKTKQWAHASRALTTSQVCCSFGSAALALPLLCIEKQKPLCVSRLTGAESVGICKCMGAHRAMPPHRWLPRLPRLQSALQPPQTSLAALCAACVLHARPAECTDRQGLHWLGISCKVHWLVYHASCTGWVYHARCTQQAHLCWRLRGRATVVFAATVLVGSALCASLSAQCCSVRCPSSNGLHGQEH